MGILLRLAALVATCAACVAAGQLPYKQILVISGNNQVIGLGEPMAPIILRVLDESGVPYQGMRIVFPAACSSSDYPGTRGCVYAPAGDSLERVSDADGFVVAPSYVANGLTGNASMNFFSRGEPNLYMASVYLRIVERGSHDPFAIQIVSGQNQEAPLHTTTTQPMVVRVVDQAGVAVAGVQVSFLAGCLFSYDEVPQPCVTTPWRTVVGLTDANGLATSPLFTVNGVPGRNPIVASFSQGLSASVGIPLVNVVPRKQASAVTGTGVSALQIKGADSCHVRSFEALGAAQVLKAPAMLAFPQGFLRIKLVGCGSMPVSISLQHTGGLPEGTRIWAATPEWRALDTSQPVEGTTTFSIADGGPGDASAPGDGYIEAVVGLGFGNPDAPNFQDLWWAGVSENGWGVSIVQHGEMLVPTIFAYDASGRPTWFAMPGGTWNEAHDVFTGSLYSPRGKPLGAHGTGDLVVGSPVGTARFQFSDAMNAELVFSVGNTVTRKTLTRQLFGPMDAGTAQRLGDMWWAGPSQSGWGLVLQQQYSTLFGVLFTYREDGSPTWFAMPSGNWTAPDTFEGLAYRSTNPTWTKAYDAAQLTTSEVGAFKLQFGAGTTGFEYVLEGRSGRVGLERLPF